MKLARTAVGVALRRDHRIALRRDHRIALLAQILQGIIINKCCMHYILFRKIYGAAILHASCFAKGKGLMHRFAKGTVMVCVKI